MATTRSQDKKLTVPAKKPVKATKKSTPKPIPKSTPREIISCGPRVQYDPNGEPKPRRKTSYKLLSSNSEDRLRALANGLYFGAREMGQMAECYAAQIALLQNDMRKDYHALGEASFGLDRVKKLLRNYAKDYYREHAKPLFEPVNIYAPDEE